MANSLDTALLLYMLDESAPIHGRLKVQKTPFFVGLGLAEEGLVGPTFDFIRYKNGPFSQAVWNGLDHLVAYQFLRKHDYGLTERGLFLRDLVGMLRKGNEKSFDLMDTALRYCRVRSGQVLMHEAYEVELEPVGIPGRRIAVRDIPMGVSILSPTETTLEVPEDLARIIGTELSTTPDELEAAAASAAMTEREATGRLLAAIPENRPF